uniref:Uncharacterized protein n=1 Tax=Candidatus Methanogaster sp. ANME-2c ERB4 TaxID=2759911 RepID=A0A7G9YJ16_9EURY|nr:hypothetical protein KNONPEEI_00039 [Methanosarcinales archaeon ANME-2c ERB4]
MWEWDNDYWEDSYRNEYRLSLLGLDFHQLASMNLSRHASVLCGFISQVLPKIYLHSVLQLIKNARYTINESLMCTSGWVKILGRC